MITNNHLTYRYDKSGLTLFLKVRAKHTIRVILALLALLPLVGWSILTVNYLLAPSFDLMSFMGVTFIAGLTFYFLGKLFLWNSFGTEIIRITDRQFSIRHDYHFFQTKAYRKTYRQLDPNYWLPNMIPTEDSVGYLSLSVDREIIDSHVKLYKRDLEKACHLVMDFMLLQHIEQEEHAITIHMN